MLLEKVNFTEDNDRTEPQDENEDELFIE